MKANTVLTRLTYFLISKKFNKQDIIQFKKVPN